MIKAFVRIFAISFFSILGLVFLGLGSQLLGKSSYRGSSFQHPLKAFINNKTELSPKALSENSILFVRVHYTNDQWQSLPPAPPLNELLKTKKKLFLQIEGRGSVPINLLATEINRTNKTNDVIIGADYLQTLKVARKIEPRFLYTSHDNQILQLNMMSSLFLEKIASTKYDIVALVDTSKNPPSPKTRKELEERNILVLKLTP